MAGYVVISFSPTRDNVYIKVIVFSEGFGASFTFTLLCALVLPVLFFLNYVANMNVPSMNRERLMSVEKSCEDELHARASFGIPMDSPSGEEEAKDYSAADKNPIHASQTNSVVNESGDNTAATSDSDSCEEEGGHDSKVSNAQEHQDGDLSTAAALMTAKERLAATLSLWPFMIPLFLVYFAEYAMQSGVWAAMGFPISSENARNDFYEYSNWIYQAGVLVSRSSGTVWKADMKALWIMPLIQVGLLVFFIIDAYFKLWYDWSILCLCFVVGLFGGAVSYSRPGLIHNINYLTSIYVISH